MCWDRVGVSGSDILYLDTSDNKWEQYFYHFSQIYKIEQEYPFPIYICINFNFPLEIACEQGPNPQLLLMHALKGKATNDDDNDEHQ